MAEPPLLNYTSVDEPVLDEPARAGRFLVVGHTADLPARCLVCNAPASDSALFILHNQRAFRLHVVTPVTTVRAHFCWEHFAQHRRDVRMGCVFALTVCGLGGGGFATIIMLPERVQLNPFVLLGVLTFCTAALVPFALRKPIGLKVHKVRGNVFYLTGAGEAFLQSLPEAPAALR